MYSPINSNLNQSYPAKERIAAAENATSIDLAAGPAGVAGLVPSVLLKLRKWIANVSHNISSQCSVTHPLNTFDHLLLNYIGDINQQLGKVHKNVRNSLTSIHARCEDTTDWMVDGERYTDLDSPSDTQSLTMEHFPLTNISILTP